MSTQPREAECNRVEKSWTKIIISEIPEMLSCSYFKATLTSTLIDEKRTTAPLHDCLLNVSRTHWASLDSDSKESAPNAEDLGLIPGLGRSPGEGNGNSSYFFSVTKKTHIIVLLSSIALKDLGDGWSYEINVNQEGTELQRFHC